MLKKCVSSVGFLLALVLVVAPLWGASVEEFYKGKTIRFIVGFAAGGGFDTYTRIIARHFGKHVPGSPSTWSKI